MTNNRSNRWVSDMMRWLAGWRDKAAKHYAHDLGTIIVFGNTMESIDAPAVRIERQADNDNTRRAI